MFTYSKLAQAGIAAVSYLAETQSENRLVGSAEIAEARELSHVLVAKILTMLSQAGLVFGKPGPSGGYQLARPAKDIAILDVVTVFENPEEKVMCPFGPNWCGVKEPNCPLHDTFVDIRERVLNRLKSENFSQFQG